MSLLANKFNKLCQKVESLADKRRQYKVEVKNVRKFGWNNLNFYCADAVLSWLDVKELFAIQRVCRQWLTITNRLLSEQVQLTTFHEPSDSIYCEDKCHRVSAHCSIQGALSKRKLIDENDKRFFSVLNTCCNIETLHLHNVQIELSELQIIYTKCHYLECLHVKNDDGALASIDWTQFWQTIGQKLKHVLVAGEFNLGLCFLARELLNNFYDSHFSEDLTLWSLCNWSHSWKNGAICFHGKIGKESFQSKHTKNRWNLPYFELKVANKLVVVDEEKGVEEMKESVHYSSRQQPNLTHKNVEELQMNVYSPDIDNKYSRRFDVICLFLDHVLAQAETDEVEPPTPSRRMKIVLEEIFNFE